MPAATPKVKNVVPEQAIATVSCETARPRELHTHPGEKFRPKYWMTHSIDGVYPPPHMPLSVGQYLTYSFSYSSIFSHFESIFSLCDSTGGHVVGMFLAAVLRVFDAHCAIRESTMGCANAPSKAQLPLSLSYRLRLQSFAKFPSAEQSEGQSTPNFGAFIPSRMAGSQPPAPGAIFCLGSELTTALACASPEEAAWM